LELATGIRFYTDNNDFLDGKTLQISPLYSVQGHLIYSFTAGLWVGLDGLYYTGGRPTINVNKGESNENARVGLTFTLPVNKYNSVKLYGNTGVYTRPGPTTTPPKSYGNFVGALDFRSSLNGRLNRECEPGNFMRQTGREHFLLMTEACICTGLRLETRFVFPVYLRVTLVARLRQAVTEGVDAC
jgi:hypothetical protein